MSIFNTGLLYEFTFTEKWQMFAVQIAFIVIAIVASYLLGSINSAIIVSKALYKDDIRKYGSGNAGMTNMLRTYGKGAAGLTLLGDVLKTAIAILFTAFLFGFHYNRGMSLDDGYCYMAGLFAVLGHVFPIYYGFRGGKGVLVTAAMALILTPVPFVILITLFIIIVAISKYVSLGSVTVAILYPVVVKAYIQFGFVDEMGNTARTPGILMLCLIILAVFIVWCHRENLVRISNRTERKISVGGKKKKNEDGQEQK